MKPSKKMMTVSDELRFIQKQNKGLLDPAKVVDFARDPKTVLHSKFEWDNSKAGELYRIWQARKIISLELVVISRTPKGKIELIADTTEVKGKLVRSYVSLLDDRVTDNGKGYRSLVDVLKDPDMREQMLEQARNDMRIFRRKYDSLSELSEVFEAMDKVMPFSPERMMKQQEEQLNA
jgi:hypothetical protein